MEVRPSGGSTDVRPTGGRPEVRRDDGAPAAKDHFKPSPPSKYSGDDSKVKVAMWLRSMMMYLQLTNTHPTRWALAAETYLMSTALTMWNSTRDALSDAPTWTDFSDCLNKHFADRFAAQKLLRTLDTARVEGVLSTVSAQLMTRQVVTALEQYDATPGVYRKDLGTQCDYLQAALRRGQPSVGQQGGNEGDKARALARKTDTAFRAGRLPDLTAIADYIVSHAPTVDDVAVARSTRGGGGGNGTGGGHADGHTGGGQVRGSDRGPDKGKGRPSHGDRNGNGKRPQADGGGGPSKHGDGSYRYASSSLRLHPSSAR